MRLETLTAQQKRVTQLGDNIQKAMNAEPQDVIQDSLCVPPSLSFFCTLRQADRTRDHSNQRADTPQADQDTARHKDKEDRRCSRSGIPS